MASRARSCRSTRAGSAGSRCPSGKRRRFRAWIFTAVRSRHRFVYPTFEETTARAIEACEAAWDFFGGIFTVLIPDNTKAIIIDGRSARAAHHAGVSRVRAGAPLSHRCRARATCPATRGASNGPCPASATTASPAKSSRRSTTRARGAGTGASTTTACAATVARSAARSSTFRPRSRPLLLPAPTTPYDIPLWSEPKVARDQLAPVAKALYSIPHPYVGQRLTARADAQLVRFYARGLLIKTHPRQAARWPIDRSRSDYPVERSVYALRNVDALRRQAEAAGEVIGRYAAALLDSPLAVDAHAARLRAARPGPPLWRGARRPRSAPLALAADMLDVRRLQRMLEHGVAAPPAAPPARVIPLARYLRPATQYALPLRPARPSEGEELQ